MIATGHHQDDLECRGTGPWHRGLETVKCGVALMILLIFQVDLLSQWLRSMNDVQTAMADRAFMNDDEATLGGATIYYCCFPAQFMWLVALE